MKHTLLLFTALGIISCHGATLTFNATNLGNAAAPAATVTSPDVTLTSTSTMRSESGNVVTYTITLNGDFTANAQVDADVITFVILGTENTGTWTPDAGTADPNDGSWAVGASANALTSTTTTRWSMNNNRSITFTPGSGSVTLADSTYSGTVSFTEFDSINSERGDAIINDYIYNGGGTGAGDDTMVNLPSGTGSVTLARSSGDQVWGHDLAFTFTVDVVPEPSSALLASLGAAGMLLRRRLLLCYCDRI